MSTEEICGILDISPNHLWVILHRARAKLRHLLDVEWFHRDRNAAPPGVDDSPHGEPFRNAIPSEFSYRAAAA